MVLEKALESPLTARRSNQSILKEISPEYSLEGLMLKLKLQYFGQLMQRTDTSVRSEDNRKGLDCMVQTALCSFENGDGYRQNE